MVFIQDQDMIQALFTSGPHLPFRESIRQGSLIRGVNDLHLLLRKHDIERRGEVLIIVADKNSHILTIILLVPGLLASLLGNPGRVGVGRTAYQMNAPGSQFNEEKHIDGFEPDGFHSKEIAGQDLIHVVFQVNSLGTRRSFTDRCYLMTHQAIAY